MKSYNLTRQEAADILEISVRSLDRHIKSWKIRSKKKWKSVYINADDVENIKFPGKSTPIIITNTDKKNKDTEEKQFNSTKLSKKEDLSKITKTFENIYTDLRIQIDKKDKIIQEMSIQLWISKEKVNQSISVSEHNRSQMLLEESKTHIAKQMTSLSEEKKELEKNLKDEKFDKKVLIAFVFILLIMATYFWFKSV